MSCNGCRFLRKGCSSDCTLRPCLQWINSPDSQANATLFLAKFYGRAGLINLVNAGPPARRSEIFRSLLYEACGRIINPVYGSVGLMCSGNWSRCQAAVEAVLQGAAITTTDSATPPTDKPVHGCDIRHLSKDATAARVSSTSRSRFKRSGGGGGQGNKRRVNLVGSELVTSKSEMKFTITGWECGEDYERAASHDSGSVETVEQALMNRAEQSVRGKPEPGREIGLELTLGPNPVRQPYGFTVIDISDSES